MKPEDREEDAEKTDEGRNLHSWPYRRVAFMLLVMVIAMVGGAFALDRWLRPPVGIQPVDSGSVALKTPAPGSAATAAASGQLDGSDLASDSLKQEIIDAYFHYWNVRSQAYLVLDPTMLNQVLADPKLAREQQQIQEFGQAGTAVKVDVEHHVLVVQASPDHALLYDEYLNRSVFIDAVTKQELPAKEPPSVEKISYEMRKMDGVWKVVDGRQHR